VNEKILTRPSWIRGKVSFDENAKEVGEILQRSNLNSVCIEAACPNKGECWQAKHVTFMILGSVCTRSCLFCNVDGGSPEAPDVMEPEEISKAVKKLAIKYCVITSVTRDDLEDQGAGHFIDVVDQIKTESSDTIVELLIPDFAADPEFLRKIAFSKAEVIGHNIEMPEPFYPEIRPEADYSRSLEVLRLLDKFKKKDGADILTKSSLMLGLGEEEEDIFQALEDLRAAGVDIVYLGQYLSPSRKHWPVKKYYRPLEFKSLESRAKSMGFRGVSAGPMVRSSYRAYESYIGCKI